MQVYIQDSSALQHRVKERAQRY